MAKKPMKKPVKKPVKKPANGMPEEKMNGKMKSK